MAEDLLRSGTALPLRQRLTRLVALCAGLTALLCIGAVIGTGWRFQEAQAREESAQVARTLSYALQAALAFDDRRGMINALGMLRGRPQISGAWFTTPAVSCWPPTARVKLPHPAVKAAACGRGN